MWRIFHVSVSDAAALLPLKCDYINKRSCRVICCLTRFRFQVFWCAAGSRAANHGLVSDICRISLLLCCSGSFCDITHPNELICGPGHCAFTPSVGDTWTPGPGPVSGQGPGPGPRSGPVRRTRTCQQTFSGTLVCSDSTCGHSLIFSYMFGDDESEGYQGLLGWKSPRTGVTCDQGQLRLGSPGTGVIWIRAHLGPGSPGTPVRRQPFIRFVRRSGQTLPAETALCLFCGCVN